MNVALREILGILYNLFLFGMLHTVRVAAENGQSYLSVITIYLSYDLGYLLIYYQRYYFYFNKLNHPFF